MSKPKYNRESIIFESIPEILENLRLGTLEYNHPFEQRQAVTLLNDLSCIYYYAHNANIEQPGLTKLFRKRKKRK